MQASRFLARLDSSNVAFFIGPIVPAKVSRWEPSG